MDLAALRGLKWKALRQTAHDYSGQALPDAYERAAEWYEHPDTEVRFFAIAVLGKLAGRESRALPFLYDHCGEDPAWQVNERLAMAFDDYCAAVGYQEALPAILRWLEADRPNLRRAVSEGLRPWASSKRAYFAAHPTEAVRLLGMLRDDPSRYVQESAGNALRDISRKHSGLVFEALERWRQEAPESKSRCTVARFALRNAIKDDPSLRRIYE